MRVENIEDLKKWAQTGSRSVEIKIGELNNPEYFRVWVYDYNLREGQAIRELPAEIDIIQAAREKLFRVKEDLEAIIREAEDA